MRASYEVKFRAHQEVGKARLGRALERAPGNRYLLALQLEVWQREGRWEEVEVLAGRLLGDPVLCEHTASRLGEWLGRAEVVPMERRAGLEGLLRGCACSAAGGG
jgi:uncharacterized protein HemY